MAVNRQETVKSVSGTIIKCECGRCKLFVFDDEPNVADPAGVGHWVIFDQVGTAIAPIK